MALRNSTVDVFLATYNQVPGDRSGVVGRIKSIKNGVVTHYDPGNGRPRRVVVQQRTAFDTLTTVGHNSSTGVTETVAWSNPELLSTAGDQLLSIANAIPRVYDGTDWTHYGDERVVSNILSESVVHTSQRTIVAPDSAWKSGVTCSVWVERISPESVESVLYIGFKADDGTWVRTPQVLYDPNGDYIPLARCIADASGPYFWVVFNGLVTVNDSFIAKLYDMNGQEVDSDTTTGKIWVTTPGYWDIVQIPGGGCLLAQPLHDDPDDTDGVRFTAFTQTAGSITATTTDDATIHCRGPLAWVTNDLADGFQYLAVIGLGEEPSGQLWGYQIDPASLGAFAHEYDFEVSPAVDTIVDSLIGFVKPSDEPPVPTAPFGQGGNGLVLWTKGDYLVVPGDDGLRMYTAGNAASPSFNPGLISLGTGSDAFYGPEINLDTLDGVPAWTFPRDGTKQKRVLLGDVGGGVRLKDRNGVNIGYAPGETQSWTWLAVVVPQTENNGLGGQLGGCVFRLGNATGTDQDAEAFFEIYGTIPTAGDFALFSNDWPNSFASALLGPATPQVTYDGVPLLIHYESSGFDDIQVYVSGPGIGTMVPLALTPSVMQAAVVGHSQNNKMAYAWVDEIYGPNEYDRWFGLRVEDAAQDFKLTTNAAALTQTYAYFAGRYPTLNLSPV